MVFIFLFSQHSLQRLLFMKTLVIYGNKTNTVYGTFHNGEIQHPNNNNNKKIPCNLLENMKGAVNVTIAAILNSSHSYEIEQVFINAAEIENKRAKANFLNEILRDIYIQENKIFITSNSNLDDGFEDLSPREQLKSIYQLTKNAFENA